MMKYQIAKKGDTNDIPWDDKCDIPQYLWVMMI